MKEIVLYSLKTSKRYCQIILNLFLNKKIFDNDKKNLINMIDFLCKVEILLLNMLKILGLLFKISGFTSFFSIFVKFQVFSSKLSNFRFLNVK